MEKKFLTVKDLAKRWNCSEGAIREHIRNGIISPSNVPITNRFDPDYIAEIEGTKLEKFSPLLKRRMERDIEELKKENEELKSILIEQAQLGIKCMQYIGERIK